MCKKAMESLVKRKLSEMAIFGDCSATELENDIQLQRLSKLVINTIMIIVFIISGDDSPDIIILAKRLKEIGHEVVFAPCGESDVKGFISGVVESAEGKKIMLCYKASDFGAMWNVLYNLQVVYSNPDDMEELKFAVYNTRPIERTIKRIDYGKPQTETPLFSIIIPSRGNSECLRYCVKTVMAQTCQEFEVIISDNSVDGDTGVFELVEELRWEKITYVRPDRTLNLVDSFEFAHQYARGEYILSLGADDGILLHGIALLKKLVEQSEHKLDALVFDYMFYGWDNALVNKFKNYIKIPKSIVKEKTVREIKTVDTNELMLQYARFENLFHKLPNGYMYSIISRRVFDTLKNKLGRRFLGAQDTYTGCNICSILKVIHSLDLPLSIVGTSGPSVGAAASSGSNTCKVQHFCMSNKKKMLCEAQINDINEAIPKEHCQFFGEAIISVPNIINSVENKLLQKKWIDKIDWKRYFEMCLSYVYDDDSDEHFSAKMEDIREKVELRGDSEIIKWFYSQYYDNKEFKGAPVPSNEPFTDGLLPNGALYLDGRDFDVHNVYDAAVFFEKIANFKTGFTYPPTDW